MNLKEFFIPTKSETRYPAVMVDCIVFHDMHMHYDALEKAFRHFTSSFLERNTFANKIDSGEIPVEFGYLVNNETFEVFDEKKSAYRRKNYVEMCVF